MFLLLKILLYVDFAFPVNVSIVRAGGRTGLREHTYF